MKWLRNWARFLVWYVTHDRNAMHRRAQAAEAALGQAIFAASSSREQCKTCLATNLAKMRRLERLRGAPLPLP